MNYSIHRLDNETKHVMRDGEQIGYIEDFKLYMFGKLIGEFSTYAECCGMIEKELGQ